MGNHEKPARHRPWRAGPRPAQLASAALRGIMLIGLLAPVSTVSADPTVIEQFVAQHSTEDLPGIQKRKQLRALVTYSRTDFAVLPNGKPRGLQVELLHNLEKALNKGIEREIDKTRIFLIPTTFDRLLTDLEQGKGDIAAALLTITPARSRRVAFATGQAMNVNELVVVHKDVSGIRQVDDLAGREVYVLRNSSYVEHLQALNRRLVDAGKPAVKITQADSKLLSEDILELVNAGVVPITVIDDYKGKLGAKVLPDIRVLEDVAVKTGTTVGWAVRKDNPLLLKRLSAYAQTVKRGTLLGNILFKRYYEDPHWIRNPLADSERSKFRKVVDLFARYSATYDIDVLATTAQAYQESALDHSKRSHRGAVGIMQLLPSTAADPNVGIEDISGLEDNIHAGVKYLAFLRDRYFSDPQISDEDRMAFSWAAYNAGPANVSRMRRKAEQMGLDPNVWFGNVELAASRIVGRETVRYVRNVFKYYIAYSLARDRLLPASAAKAPAGHPTPRSAMMHNMPAAPSCRQGVADLCATGRTGFPWRYGKAPAGRPETADGCATRRAAQT